MKRLRCAATLFQPPDPSALCARSFEFKGTRVQGGGGFDGNLLSIAPVSMQRQAPPQHGFNAFTEEVTGMGQIALNLY